MSVEAAVARSAKVVTHQSHVGSMAGDGIGNLDLFTHTFTPVVGHRYLLIACGGVMYDTGVNLTLRHLLSVGGENVTTILQSSRSGWAGTAGVPLRLSLAWQAPSNAQVTAKWTFARDTQHTGWALSDGVATFTIIDLGPS